MDLKEQTRAMNAFWRTKRLHDGEWKITGSEYLRWAKAQPDFWRSINPESTEKLVVLDPTKPATLDNIGFGPRLRRRRADVGKPRKPRARKPTPPDATERRTLSIKEWIAELRGNAARQ